MTTRPPMLSDVVEVRSRFQRSVNLEKDYWGLETGDNGYIITLSARKALRFILEGLEEGGSYRSITLTGPYGVGKSAFALFLTQLFCGISSTRESAIEKLQKTDPWLSQLFSEYPAIGGKKRFLPVLLTSRRAPAPLCILQGVAESLLSTENTELRKIGTRLCKETGKASYNAFFDSRTVVMEIEKIARTAVAEGYAGLLFIVDELGKLFEYAARDPKMGDVFVLQEIAEHAARSGDAPVVIVGLLHQGFDEYAKHLDIATRQEWAKIQGRFIDIAFQEPTEQLIRLIASAIQWKNGDPPLDLKRHLRNLAKGAISAGINPPAMAEAEFEEVVSRSYPLHPSALVALPVLFNRFAQNERSLFSYLNSLEPGAFQTFLSTQRFHPSNPPLIRLPELFNYFTFNFGAGLYRQPHARRWLEATDALDRKVDLTDIHEELVKTIGLLSVVGEFSHLRATERTIAFSIDGSEKFSKGMRQAMNDLREYSLLTYRKFNDTYRVWEGSDIDIEERISEGARKVHGSGFGSIIQKYLSTRPMVARRHSFETGALRYFELSYVDDPDDISYQRSTGSKADGIIIVCLADSSSQAKIFQERAELEYERSDIIFAIPQHIGDLRAASMELAALRWAWENTPQLRDDRVARRELAMRITEAEQLLTKNISILLDPRAEPIGSGCHWIREGAICPIDDRFYVSQLLSKAFDELFHSTPTIRNELITRRSLSSAAAAARRNLIEAMLEKGDQVLLGIEGYPPERSMYESVLLATGLHAELPDGKWVFTEPTDSPRHHLKPTWDFISKSVFEGRAEPLGVDELFKSLSAPPYGVLDGLHPLLLCAFMQAHPDETTLYREGTFLPEPGIADFEVLMRRPELFSVTGTRVSGVRSAVVNRLSKSLNVSPATVPVVRALFRMVKNLPEFTWNTRRLPKTSLALRDSFQNAKSPEKFLFVELPESLGLKAFSGSKHMKEDIDDFFNALNTNLQNLSEATNTAISAARDILLKECGFKNGEEQWQGLRNTAVALEPFVTEPHLLTFLKRVTQSDADASEVESVLALVSNRPPRNWTDMDVDKFPEAAASIGNAFREMVRLRGSAPDSGTQMEALTQDERRQAKEIKNRVRKYLCHNINNTSPRALRAAMASLLEELNDE